MGELAYSIAHVVPSQDSKDHDVVSGQCWCNPVIEIRFDRITLYHHLDDPIHHKGHTCYGPHSAAPRIGQDSAETAPAL